MKNILLFVCFLISANIQAFSQPLTYSTQTILKGNYELMLLHKPENNSSALYLKTNLPATSKVEINFEVTQSNGVKNEITVQQYPYGQRIFLYKSSVSIQHLRILNLTLKYVLFGEEYSLHWDHENTFMSFIRQGRTCNYTNPFTLCATEFYWSHGMKPMAESEDDSKIIQLSKN